MITLNFDEVLKRIYNAKKGVEVRYGLGQGFEYCKQFADEAQGHATNAKASADKAEQTVAGIEQTKTDAVQEVQNAQTTATTAITQTKDAALTDIGNAKTGALQEVANSTATAETAASAAAGSASDANASKEAAVTSAAAAADSASAASTSETNSSASASAAATSEANAKKYSEEAGAKASTDKTLSIENAPADAKAVGDIILDRTKETPQPIFYSKAEVEAKIKEILAAQREKDLARIRYWVSDDPTSPASFIGGTWEQIKDRFILAAGDIYAAGSTGGSPSHNHSIGAMFASAYFNGQYVEYKYSGNTEWVSNYKNTIPDGATANFVSETHSSGITVYGSPTKEASNMPPYITMYVWKRIA